MKIGWAEILRILTNAGRGMLEIVAITGLAGVVIGVLQLTGLGFTLTLTLLNIGQSNALLLLVLTAIVSIILGMGMPTTAVYVLLAVLVAPGLAKLGIVPIAAHLFIFYFGMLSMVTPPVCMASYAAASIGKTDPVQTGWEAMKLCSIAYIVPFSICLFAIAFVDRPLVRGGAFGGHRDHWLDTAWRRHRRLFVSPGGRAEAPAVRHRCGWLAHPCRPQLASSPV